MARSRSYRHGLTGSSPRLQLGREAWQGAREADVSLPETGTSVHAFRETPRASRAGGEGGRLQLIADGTVPRLSVVC